jgi:hypothetical protein
MATLNPTDLFDVRSLLTEEEQMIQDTVARFVDERALPLMADAFDKAQFPMGTRFMLTVPRSKSNDGCLTWQPVKLLVVLG